MASSQSQPPAPGAPPQDDRAVIKKAKVRRAAWACDRCYSKKLNGNYVEQLEERLRLIEAAIRPSGIIGATASASTSGHAHSSPPPVLGADSPASTPMKSRSSSFTYTVPPSPAHSTLTPSPPILSHLSSPAPSDFSPNPTRALDTGLDPPSALSHAPNPALTDGKSQPWVEFMTGGLWVGRKWDNLPGAPKMHPEKSPPSDPPLEWTPVLNPTSSDSAPWSPKTTSDPPISPAPSSLQPDFDDFPPDIMDSLVHNFWQYVYVSYPMLPLHYPTFCMEEQPKVLILGLAALGTPHSEN
ncbi:hypothetical protein BDK51DRAFT_33592, partial [Blyttiomyces helicus]